MKPSISKLLSIAGLSNSNQKYLCAYYLIKGKVHFLHVVEMPTYKKNAYIACFGLPDGYSFTDAELDGHLKEWLKTNKGERYEDRTPNDRMRDIMTFDYSQLKQ